MKPHTAPTSPKYPHEQRLHDVWHGPSLQQPVKAPLGQIMGFSLLSAGIAVAVVWGVLIWLAIAHPNSFLVKALPSSVTTIIQSVPTVDRSGATPTAVSRAAEGVISIVPEKATSPITQESVTGQGILLTSTGWAWIPKTAQPAGTQIKTATATATFGVTKTLSDSLTATNFIKTTQGSARALDLVDPNNVQDGQQVWVITRRLQNVSITPKRLRILGAQTWQSCESYHAAWEVGGGWNDTVGGTVVDEKGRVLGFVGTDGLIIPADIIQSVLDRVLQQNSVSRPACGFRMLQHTDVIVSKQTNEARWIVGAKGADAAVTSKGPADTAGLKSGDQITKIDGEKLPADPGQYFRSVSLGQSIKLEVLRGTTKVNLTLKISALNP